MVALKRKGNTRVFANDNGGTVVQLYNTEVVVFGNGHTKLNSGGYRTTTTKQRMNQASDEFQLGFNVFQRDYGWFVNFFGQVIPFTDGMIFDRPQ